MESAEFNARVTAAKARAHGIWPDILARLRIGREYLVNKHGPCPVCRGKDRFRFDDKHGNGEYFCNGCGAGNGFGLLSKYHGWDFLTTLREVEQAVGILPPAQERTKNELSGAKLRKLAKRIWDEAKPVTPGDEVATYLANRGLAMAEYPRVLRTHPKLGYYVKRGTKSRLLRTYPALLGVVQGMDGHAVTLHRTYLDGGRKADVEGNKKLLNAGINGAAIRLFQPETELALAEGIETALAVHMRTGLPVWATINAGNMEHVWIPDAVKKVCIYADHDAKWGGQAAAYALAHRLATQQQTKEIQVFVPRNVGTDWNDVWVAKLKVAA